MSYDKTNSNFYIVQVSDDSYSLHNTYTDNRILNSVEHSNLRDFLALNEPDHPFLYLGDIEKRDLETSSLIDRLTSRLDRTREYEYNPFCSTSETYYNPDYTTQYETYDFGFTPDVKGESIGDYLNRAYSDVVPDTQLTFSFVEEYVKDITEDNSFDEKDNVLPFIPDGHEDKDKE